MQTVSKKDDFAVRWPNTVFARAFAVAIQRAHKDFKKTNITPLLSVLLFSTIECSVLMALVFYYKDMLEKVMMQRTQVNATHAQLLKKLRPIDEKIAEF